MILNGNAGSHDYYLPNRKQKQQQPRKRKVVAANPCPRGTLEDKLAWMRARQAAKRGEQGASS